MAEYYRPAHDDLQLLASDPYGSRSCLAYAAATAIDYHSLGELRPTGRQVREATDDPTAGPPEHPGLNLGNIDVAWRTLAGEPLQYTYQGTWTQIRARRAEGRYVLMTGRYSAIPILGRCQKAFTGPHGIALSPSDLTPGGRWLIDDPLCSRALGHTEAVLRAYALALNPDGRLQFGWTDAHPPLPEPIIAEDPMIAISIGRASVPAGTSYSRTPGGAGAGSLLATHFTILGTPAGFPDWRALVRRNRQIVYVRAAVLTSLPNWPHGEALQTALMDGRLPLADCAEEVETATAPLIARIDIIKRKAAAFGADVSDD